MGTIPGGQKEMKNGSKNGRKDKKMMDWPVWRG